MSKTDTLLEQARRGNSQAIAALLSRQLKPKHIQTQVKQKSEVLNILFEADKTPSQSQLVPWATKVLNDLHLDGINVIHFYARIQGKSDFSWKTQVEILQKRSLKSIEFSNPNKELTITKASKSQTSHRNETPDSNSNEVIKTTKENWNPVVIAALSFCMVVLFFNGINSLITALFFGLFPALLAAREGRSFLMWWLYGSALLVVSTIHLFIVIHKQESNQDVSAIFQYLDGFLLISLAVLYLIIFGVASKGDLTLMSSADVLLGVILPHVFPGLFCAYIAVKKNMNFIRWFTLGSMGWFSLFIPMFLVLREKGKTAKQIEEKKNKKEEIEVANKIALENKKKQEEDRLNSLLSNKSLIFEQSASYRGGVKGFPKRLEEIGTAYITSDSFVFFNPVMDFQLFYSRILDVDLDYFQMGEARAFWASGDVARQLQNTKNVLNITYIDEDNIERNAQFQIHGSALMIQGEALKAQEFLNHLLEFKKEFHKKEMTLNSLDDDDTYAKIKKLKNLLDQDMITQQDFVEQKKKILDEI